MTSLETLTILRALNAEARRTNGEHPAGHVLVLDGIAYSVPRRQWGMTHSASGRPFGLPRAKADTLHLRRVSTRLTTCACSMCKPAHQPEPA